MLRQSADDRTLPDVRLLTPSKVTAWLDCPHYLTLTGRVEKGSLSRPEQPRGSYAQLLVDKGLAHENACRDAYEIHGTYVHEVPDRLKGETFEHWVERIGNPLADGHAVVYQMPFIHDGVRGIADFLERIDHPDGTMTYEPVDAKLARKAAKPGHVLQLCFYAGAIEALTGSSPEHMHVWLGSDHRETLRVNDFQPYWRRLRTQLAGALDADSAETVPRMCPHCEFCEFNPFCEAQWRSEDSLIYVAGIHHVDIEALTAAGVDTLSALADTQSAPPGVRPERWTRLVKQAALQIEAVSHVIPPFQLIPRTGDPVWGCGYDELPEPNDGDVFIDFEGHPFWRPDTDLFFLFGALERDSHGGWTYRTWWAHDLHEEAAITKGFIDYLEQRRVDYPQMHAYHYNHTERSSLQRLAQDHGVGEVILNDLIEHGLFVDLYVVARNSFQVGTESYGLKHLELLAGFERSHDIDKGAGAVVQYETFMTTHDEAALRPIAQYNEDDVRATMALRDWLVDQRPPELDWRPDEFEPPPGIPELDQRVTRLHAAGQGTPEHRLGDLLGYWWREYMADYAPKMAKLTSDPVALFEDPEAIGGLTRLGIIERRRANGEPILPAMRFAFPQQSMERFPRRGGRVAIVGPKERLMVCAIHDLDLEAFTIDVVWNEVLQQQDSTPQSLVVYDWIDPTPKALALESFADQVLDGRAPHAVTMAMLCGLPPTFHGAGPIAGEFTADLGDIKDWIRRLDSSFVAIQGPPGAGKTYTAAHLVHSLVLNGARVGVTATSHHAIVNVLEAVLEVFDAEGGRDNLNAMRNPGNDKTRLDWMRHGDNIRCARAGFNLIAGTTWLFSSLEMRGTPVDYLFIDEAGQVALADALAASTSARNVILLGDPQQLSQVAKASHPNGSGVSVLDYAIGDGPTVAPDRGVFLPETWRMHPDITNFVSDQFYEGRLHSRPHCRGQRTELGTGLRWLQMHHHGNRTSSAEEADVIAKHIEQLIGTPWTDRRGQTLALTAGDFMVVTPYNDQVRTIKKRLEADPVLAAVPVGTVDKFQGREAVVVLFSMATSSGADMTRGADFLFSRNRLNVAVSRARCLAYLLCTEELLTTKAKTVEDMRLISSLNAFVEYARRPSHRPTYIAP